MRVTEIQNGVLGLAHLPGAVKPWRLTIQDREAGEVIWIDLTDEVAKQITEKLNTGIQIARTIPQ